MQNSIFHVNYDRKHSLAVKVYLKDISSFFPKLIQNLSISSIGMVHGIRLLQRHEPLFVLLSGTADHVAGYPKQDSLLEV